MDSMGPQWFMKSWKLFIVKVKIVNEKEWKSFVERTKGSTFFHTYDWYKIWEDYAGYKSMAYLFHFDSGHKVLLPLASKKILKGLMASYQSSLAGTYGGFITDDVLKEEEARFLVKWLRSFNSISITFNPFSNLNEILPFQSKDFTQTILLTESWNTLIGRMKNAQIVRKVNIARRNQLSLKKIKSEEVELYHKIYLSRRENWDNPTNFYQLPIFELLYKSDQVDFWGVYSREGSLICAGPFVRHNDHVSSWLAVALTEYLRLKPYEFLYYNLILHYKKLGLKWFDFNPSGGHLGVVRFKKGFGATENKVMMFNQYSILASFLLKTSNVIRRVRVR